MLPRPPLVGKPQGPRARSLKGGDSKDVVSCRAADYVQRCSTTDGTGTATNSHSHASKTTSHSNSDSHSHSSEHAHSHGHAHSQAKKSDKDAKVNGLTDGSIDRWID